MSHSTTAEPIPRSMLRLRRIALFGVLGLLGGARQAVLLRGADTANPVVLFLHGGPGMPTMYLAHAFPRNHSRCDAR